MVNHVDKIDEAFNLRPMPKLKVEQQEVKTSDVETDGLRLKSPTPMWDLDILSPFFVADY